MRSVLEPAGAGRASYWDALLVETAGGGGCKSVLSEDMADGSQLGSIRIVNPFSAEAPGSPGEGLF